MTEDQPRDTVDPGDSVPEGVAPLEPPELTEEERRVKEKLERLPEERQPEA